MKQTIFARNESVVRILCTLVAAGICGMAIVSLWSEGGPANVFLSSKFSEAQQEENEVQAMESKFLLRERAKNQAETKAFDATLKLSKKLRDSRPLWGGRKWPSYYQNVFNSKGSFSADEPKHPLRSFDSGDDDSSIDFVHASKRQIHRAAVAPAHAPPGSRLALQHPKRALPDRRSADIAAQTSHPLPERAAKATAHLRHARMQGLFEARLRTAHA